MTNGDERAPGPEPGSVFFDGTLTDPRLDYPEGLAVHRSGSTAPWWSGPAEGRGALHPAGPPPAGPGW